MMICMRNHFINVGATLLQALAVSYWRNALFALQTRSQHVSRDRWLCMHIRNNVQKASVHGKSVQPYLRQLAH